MPWPSGYVQVQVAGTFKDWLNDPMSGFVSFEPSQLLVDEFGQQIITPAIRGIKLVNGAFQTYLLATDEPRVSPQGWHYVVTISIKGGMVLKLSVPVSMEGSVLDISVPILQELLQPGETIPPDYATAGMVQAEQAARIAADALLIPLTQRGAANGVATLDSGGKLPSSQIDGSDFVLATDKGVANGVATLGADGIVPSGQLPPPQLHVQAVASAEWTINYSYPVIPDVAVYDNNNDLVVADVDVATPGTVIVRTYYPETGRVYLRW